MKKLDMVGKVFSEIEVLSFCKIKNRASYFNCRCFCGRRFVANGAKLKCGAKKSCGCLWQKPDLKPRDNLLGLGFNDLKVVSLVGRRKSGATRFWVWLCRCKCGRKTMVNAVKLVRGTTKSCGCRRASKAGASKLYSHEYGLYKAMIHRCENTRQKYFKNYGGRGIIVCKKWRKDFFSFLRDVTKLAKKAGFRSFSHAISAGLSLDRKNNNKGYCAENCRLSTRRQQAENTRRNRFLSFLGKTKTISEWAREFNMRPATLRNRVVNLKWPVRRALTEIPVIGKNQF